MLRTAITNAPRSSGGLLRPTRSLGSLRATAAAQSQQQPMVPPVPSRNLVSSVLLSRDAYDRQNVNQLKGELKTRGLTTSGRRAELVIRLLNDDAQRSGSGLVLDNVAAKEPKLRRGKASLASLRGKDGGKTGTQASSATPTNKLANDPSSTSSSASNSSAPAAPASASPKTEASPPTSAGAPIVGEGATISHPPGIKPGDTVSPSLNVVDGKVQVPEKLPSASGPPGVPPQKEPDHPETFKINIPYEEVAEVPGPDIPIVTMYTNRSTEPNRDDDQPAPIVSPKLVRASDDAEISHALEIDQSSEIGSSGASDSASSAAQSAKEEVKGEAGDLLKKLDGLKESAAEVTSSVVQDIKSTVASSGVDVSKVQETIVKAVSSDSKAEKREDGKRALNSDEKRGLYLLGGLVFGGFLAGGLGKPKKEKKEQKH